MINSEMIEKFYSELKEINLKDLEIKHSCFIVVDMINAFCKSGALASSECADIIPQLVEVLKNAKELGFKHFLFIQDRHNDSSLEFESFPPHALENSDEVHLVSEIKELNLDEHTFYKNSFSIGYNADFNKFLDEHKDINTFIIVGCCTDVCIFTTALHLRCLANEQERKRTIIIPKNLVGTYSMPTHDAPLYDYIFLKQAKEIFNVKICSQLA